MRFITAALAAMSLTLAQAHFQFDIYSQTGCGGDILFSLTGDATGEDSGTSYDYSGYVGSFKTIAIDDYTTQFNTNNGCINTGIDCCRGAPSCTQDGENLAAIGECIDIDQTVTQVASSFTVCDVVCVV